MFVSGLSLGSVYDTGALAILEAAGTNHPLSFEDKEPETGLPMPRTVQIEGPPVSLKLRHLERFKPGTHYPDIIGRVRERLLSIKGGSMFALDVTTIGADAMIEFDKGALPPTVGVMVTPGGVAGGNGRLWRVPGRDLLHGLWVSLQEKRLVIAEKLQLARVMIEALSILGHDDDESPKKSTNADLVIAVALAGWMAEREFMARAEVVEREYLLGASMRANTVQISPI